MSKSPLAIVTMCYNEPDFLPIWLKYYSRQVGHSALYIIDHGSDDGSTDMLAGGNMIRIPRSPLDEIARAAFVSEICSSLLHWYEAVMYTDIDEIVVADPRVAPDLVSFTRRHDFEVMSAIGMHMAHNHKHWAEPALDVDRGILAQRRWAYPVGSQSKPLLAKRPVRWGPGFHSADAQVRFGDLFLFHMAYMDIPLARRRQLKRNRSSRVEGHGEHHSAGEEFIAHISSWFDILPLIPGVDLGEDCPHRKFVIEQMLARSPGPHQVDITFTGPGLWHIPERFVGAF